MGGLLAKHAQQQGQRFVWECVQKHVREVCSCGCFGSMCSSVKQKDTGGLGTCSTAQGEMFFVRQIVVRAVSSRGRVAAKSQRLLQRGCSIVRWCLYVQASADQKQ